MKRAVPLLVLLGILAASPASAAPYLEFSPDYAQSLLVTSAATTVDQAFLPLNEYLSGFDFWVSTGGATGEATFTLLNASGTALGSRTVSVPAIADEGTGSRLHVNLPAQIAVAGGNAYRVRISGTLPTLRLYYAGANPLLAHNGSPLPAYTGGRAQLDGEDMDFSFLYALYENSETTPPSLSNITVNQPSVGTVVITFNATEPVDAQVSYPPSSVPFTGQFTQCLPGVQPCSVTLSVTPGTDYAYTLTARDAWGNEAVATGTFTAAGTPPTPSPTAVVSPTPEPSVSPTATPDTAPPVFTNLRAVNLTPDGATIAWETDEAANGIVAVFYLPFLTFAGTTADTTMELVHAVPVTGLMAGTGYRARVTSSDDSGNATTQTVDFITAVPTPTPAAGTPSPSPSSTPSVNAAETGVAWSPPTGGAPANGYRVDIFSADNRLVRTVTTDGTGIDIADLPAGDYRAVVYANNDGVFEKVAAPASFTVSPQSWYEQLAIWAPWILGALVVLIACAVVALVYRNKRKAKNQPPANPQAPVTGAIPPTRA